MWIRSHALGDRFIHRHDTVINGRTYTTVIDGQSGLGGVRITYNHLGSTDPNSLDGYFTVPNRRALATGGFFTSDNPVYPRGPRLPDDTTLTAMGIQFITFTDRPSGDVDRSVASLTLPWWVVFFAFATFPLYRYCTNVVKRQQEDRIALGLCPCCGEPVNEFLPSCQACNKPIVALG
jgi:hypothetical protein